MVLEVTASILPILLLNSVFSSKFLLPRRHQSKSRKQSFLLFSSLQWCHLEAKSSQGHLVSSGQKELGTKTGPTKKSINPIADKWDQLFTPVCVLLPKTYCEGPQLHWLWREPQIGGDILITRIFVVVVMLLERNFQHVLQGWDLPKWTSLRLEIFTAII